MSELLPCVEIEPRVKAERAVLWMHGLGANGHDFEPIVPLLGLPPELGVRFVFPHAPSIPVTLNAGMVMPAWFDVELGRDGFVCDEADTRRSAERIAALMEREHERGIESRRLVLAGFSQGGSMAMHVGFRYPLPLAGIMVLSTALIFPEQLEAERHEANRDTPVFQAHGVHDSVVPLRRGAATRDLLRGLGYSVTWKEYPMAHEVCGPEIADIGAWLRSVLR